MAFFPNRRPAEPAAASAMPGVADTRVHVDLTHLRGLEGHAKALSLLPRQPASSVLSGRHGSRLRGRGLDFLELRGYLPSDDVRNIDWRVTARTGEPHVRVFTEERDRPALIVVDQRMSMFFGSQHAMKSVTAAEAAALLAFAVLAQQDRVGGVVMTDSQVEEFRPARSRAGVMHFLQALAAANQALHADAAAPAPTSLDRVLESVARLARRDHLIIVLSDFDVIGPHSDSLLSALCQHNDVVLAPVTDPLAEQLPHDLSQVVSDGRQQALLNTANEQVRGELNGVSQARREQLLDWQRRFGLSIAPLSASEDAVLQLHRLLGVTRGRR
ncbi:Protein of unknown function DUF58 [Halopseudomonas sabulinigri]|uniref:DUF58 domain-containing protein n=1 Tax=Halopseudomonas sabulinigri TaxID=472181 RepID=A0A1H1L8Y5_9GAMM|nr:DUF58 domain-containing protein [Halopseudomonas sabulinigri]SDR70978.1 Protein of unknown function DUF58 [Halopseudomonas sabulinigri]